MRSPKNTPENELVADILSVQLRPVEEANIIDFKSTVVGRFSTTRITKCQMEFWSETN